MRIRVIFVIALSAVLFSCSHDVAHDKTADASDVAGEPSLFDDSTRCHNRKDVQAEMAMLIAQFPQCDEQTVRQSISRVLEAAAGDTVAFRLVTEAMEQCLDEPNSPLRDEEYYIMYLEELLRLPGLTDNERLRPTDRLETALKNRPGTVATDFAYIDRDGRRQTLHGTAAGRSMLLLFYDPECAHCTEILQQVGASAVIKDCIGRGKLTVLAVYTEGKRGLWDETKAGMPQEWTVGIDIDSIVERELYSIPAMPVMYLLDGDRRVLLKDGFLPDIEEMLKALQ